MPPKGADRREALLRGAGPGLAAIGAGGTVQLGCGGAPLGNLYAAVSDEAAQATIDAAWDLGLRYFDTAPHYGQGLSEHRLGRALRSRPRDGFLLSTKVGRLLCADAAVPDEQHGYRGGLPFRSRFDYSADGALRSIEDSLQRLGLARIDIAFIHDIDVRTHGDRQPQRFREAMQGAYRALERLRAEGTVCAIGLGVNEWQVCRQAMDHGDFDLFMLAGRYTLLDQSAGDELIPHCLARGTRLVIAGAFNSGILATGAVPGARYDYLPAGAAMLERVRRLQAVCDEHGVPLAAAALQFPAASPSVAAIVVGGRSPQEIRGSVRMAAHPIPPAFWQAVRDRGLVAAGVALPEGSHPPQGPA